MSTERRPRFVTDAHPQDLRAKPGRRRRGRRDQRGVVLVETLLVVPILLAFAFGVIDFGNDYNNWVAVRQGTREGLRQALIDTSPTPPPPLSGWTCPIVSSNPPAVDSDMYDMVCFIKAQVGLNQSDTRVKIYFVAPYNVGKAVKVCVQYKSYSMTGAYRAVLNNKALSASASSLIETSQVNMTSTVEETPITSWPASCSTL